MVRIMILEDNMVIADLIADLLKANGYEVIGIARTVAEAIRLYQVHHPDHAIVDIHLADDLLGAELVNHLGKPRPIGILFASDNASGILLTVVQGTAFIAKPFREEDLLNALAIVVDVHAKGISSLPHPPGFRLLNTLVA